MIEVGVILSFAAFGVITIGAELTTRNVNDGLLVTVFGCGLMTLAVLLMTSQP